MPHSVYIYGANIHMPYFRHVQNDGKMPVKMVSFC
jgi:hypothetical protein